MWSEPPSRRRALAALGAFAGLSACGFTPAYGPGAPATGLRGEVLPDPPYDRIGFVFVGQVEDRLGRAGDGATFALGYSLSIRTVETAQNAFGGALRLAIEGAADYSLRSRDTGKILTSGRVTGFAAYSDTGTSVALRSARADAERRIATILADEVVTRLIAAAPAA